MISSYSTTRVLLLIDKTNQIMTLNFNELALKRNSYLCIQKLHLFPAGLAVLLGVYYSVKGYQKQFEAKVLRYCHSSHK
jgi:hypothetical protein